MEGMKEWRELVAATKGHRKAWEDGFVHTPEALKPLARSVLNALDADDPPPMNLELHGALLALVGSKVTYKDSARFAPILTMQVALGGLTFALEAVVASTRFRQCVASSLNIYTEELAWIEEQDEEHDIDIDPWTALRDAVANASDADRKKAGQLALEMRKTASAPLHAALSWTFPDEPGLWTDEDARAGLLMDEDPGEIYTFASLRHVDSDDVSDFGTKKIAENLPGKWALPVLRR